VAHHTPPTTSSEPKRRNLMLVENRGFAAGWRELKARLRLGRRDWDKDEKERPLQD